MQHYKLMKDHSIVPCSPEEADKHLKDVDARTVGRTQVGDVEVSTVFLTLNHNFYQRGVPIFFETMLFKGESPSHDEGDVLHMARWSTYEQALAGHWQTVHGLAKAKGITIQEQEAQQPKPQPKYRRKIKLNREK